MSQIELQVTGPDAQTLAEELAKQIARHLGERVEPVRVNPYTLPDDEDTRGGLEVATFLLAIPSAALAVVQLVDRVRRWEALRAWVRGVDPEQGQVAVKEGGAMVPLETVDAARALGDGEGGA